MRFFQNKRFVRAVTLALLVSPCLSLSACGKAAQVPPTSPTSPTSQSAQAASAPPPAQAANGALVQVSSSLGMTRSGDKGFYRTDSPHFDEELYMMFFDYNTLEQRYVCSVPGCAHRGKSCGARVSGAVFPFVVGDALYYNYEAYPEQDKPEEAWVGAIERRKLDGTSPRLLAKSEHRGGFVLGTCKMYADDSALYTPWREFETNKILRIDLATGEVTSVTFDGEGILFEKPYGRSLLSLQSEADGGAYAPCALYATDVDSGEKTLLHEWPAEVMGFVGSMAIENNVLYYANLKTGGLWAYDLAADTETLVTDAFAQYGAPIAHNWAEELDVTAEYAAELQEKEPVTYPRSLWYLTVADGWLFWNGDVGGETVKQFGYHLETGEMKEITLTDYWNAAERPMTVHAATPHGLLVTEENRALVVQTQGQGNMPQPLETGYEVFAFIDTDDFVASKPNFCTIQPVEHTAR